MSFDLRLEATALTDGNVRRLVEFSSGPGTWPLEGSTTESSRRALLMGSQRLEPALSIAERSDGQPLFVQAGEVDGERAWVLAGAARLRFRATLGLLADELPLGFAFRATRFGVLVRHESVVSIEALAELASDPGLVETTRYVVNARFT